MAIAFVQAKSVQSSSATSITIASMTATAGNQLVAGVSQLNTTSGSIGAAVVTDNKSSTWANAWRNSATAPAAGLWYAENIPGGAGQTVTYTPTNGPKACALAVAEISGLATSFTLDQTAHADAGPSSGGVSSGATAATTTINQILVGMMGLGSVTTPAISTPGFFTDVVALGDSAPGGGILSYAIVAATGAYSYSYSFGSAGADGVGIATFKGSGIAFVQGKIVQTSGATSITTASFTSTAGHFLAATASCGLTYPSGTGITDSKSNTYSNAWKDGAGHGAGCNYAENISGGASHTVTWTPTSSTYGCLCVAEFSGINTSSSLDQTAHANVSADPHSSGATGTTAQANELLIGSGGQSSGTPTPYAVTPNTVGFIDRVSLGDGTSQGIVLATQVVAATGAYTYTARAGGSITEAIGLATFSATPTNFQTLTGPATSSTWTAVDPTIVANVTVVAPATSATWTAVAPTISANVTLAAPACPASWTAVAPSLTATVTLAAPAGLASWTVGASTLSPGLATVAAPATLATWTAVDPVITAAPASPFSNFWLVNLNQQVGPTPQQPSPE